MWNVAARISYNFKDLPLISVGVAIRGDAQRDQRGPAKVLGTLFNFYVLWPTDESSTSRSHMAERLDQSGPLLYVI